MTKSLPDKWRPLDYNEVVGQDASVKVLQGIVKRRDVHCFLFFGPSGVGKTTLARITARKLGCKDIRDIAAAVYNGVDEMRKLQEDMKYLPFGKASSRAIILDECHALSKPAWQSLLQVTEEPPDHIFWFFCTTEKDKVPDTMLTRSTSFTLKPVDQDDLKQLLIDIADEEKIKVSEGVAQTMIRRAHGSPRQLLVNLNKARDAKTQKEAEEILDLITVDNPVVLELCRFITQARGSWPKVMKLVDKLNGQEPESVRIAICNYLAVAIKNAKTDDTAGRLLNILSNFSTSYYKAETIAPLLLSIGETLFGGPKEEEEEEEV